MQTAAAPSAEQAAEEQAAEQQADDDIFRVDLEARKAGLRAQLAAFTKVIFVINSD